MKKFIICLGVLLTAISVANAQRSADLQKVRDSLREARQQAGQEILEAKKQAQSQTPTLSAAPVPSDFNDPDSFGKNVKFLGSLYAGTVYIYSSCDPTVLLNDLGLVLAPDDHCIQHTIAAPMVSTDVFDPVWQVTIPANTVDNVVYPMLNNGVGYDIYGANSGQAGIIYTPRITIESAALNDPAAIDPVTGLPMNGSYTTSLAGNRFHNFSVTAGNFDSNYENYASVSGRGLSRSYFQALGLPNKVINKLFNKPMTLKFGIRIRCIGAIDFGQFFYSFRLLGN